MCVSVLLSRGDVLKICLLANPYFSVHENKSSPDDASTDADSSDAPKPEREGERANAMTEKRYASD